MIVYFDTLSFPVHIKFLVFQFIELFCLLHCLVPSALWFPQLSKTTITVFWSISSLVPPNFLWSPTRTWAPFALILRTGELSPLNSHLIWKFMCTWYELSGRNCDFTSQARWSSVQLSQPLRGPLQSPKEVLCSPERICQQSFFSRLCAVERKYKLKKTD